jgi:hypothetical protein
MLFALQKIINKNNGPKIGITCFYSVPLPASMKMNKKIANLDLGSRMSQSIQLFRL